MVDALLTTSRGPGTAFEFALSLVRQLYGEEKMRAVAGPMVMQDFKLAHAAVRAMKNNRQVIVGNGSLVVFRQRTQVPYPVLYLLK